MNYKTILTTICTVLLVISAPAKDKVFDRPAFRSSSESDIYPVKVELTKKATIVHFRIVCAKWREWSIDGAQLVCDGKTYAYQSGRILTHDGTTVLKDESLEFLHQYNDKQQDSLILCFEPLPKGAKTFDYIEGDNDLAWKIWGIRLDNQLYPMRLPAYQPRKDDGEPLKPLTLKHGEATATITVYGGKSPYYSGNHSCDPITDFFESRTQFLDSILQYCHPAYLATAPLFFGCKVDSRGIGDEFPLILIPGETLTLEVDKNACMARDYDFAAGKRSDHDCYRLGGTIGDLNQVLLENPILIYDYWDDITSKKAYVEGQTFTEWSERLWQNLDTLKQGIIARSDYTRRQKDFLSLLVDRVYLRTRNSINWFPSKNDTLLRLKETFTLVDSHAKDLQLYRDGRTFYLPLNPSYLPYLEANGLTHGEAYEITKAFDEAKQISAEMKLGKVQSDSVILSAHPYFQPVLRAFNDSTRILVERLQREAEDRMMPVPDVPGDELLQTIVSQHPGKAVFFDLWATWCGPCMKGIEKMEPLKEKLKGKDIVFVYITDESSPLAEWSEQVLKIPGLHYRVGPSIWPLLFGPKDDRGITRISIPRYYLYNRQGERVWEELGFNDEVLETIEKEISKTLE